MKNEGSRNWRQMEWIGFWFEHFVDQVLESGTTGATGPKYGHTQFDLMLDEPWDLKAHPSGKPEIILNDTLAVDQCIADYGSINYLILSGDVEYDDQDQSFRQWHDSIKGKTTSYVTQRIAEGRPSRRRKISFKPKTVYAFQLDSKTIQSTLDSGALGYFQEGMRNSDGNPRAKKYRIKNLKRIIEFRHVVIELD